MPDAPARVAPRRPGRPTGTGAPRVLTEDLHLRIAAPLAELLRSAARAEGLSESEYARRAIAAAVGASAAAGARSPAVTP